MKKCRKCEESKPLSEYNRRGDRHQPYCRPCDNQKSRERYAENRESHLLSIRARSDRYRAEVRLYVSSLKESQPCSDCGKSYPHYVMDYDHTGTDKLFNIANAVNRGFSLEKIKTEISKCQLVCSNCHRIRTHNRRTNID